MMKTRSLINNRLPLLALAFLCVTAMSACLKKSVPPGKEFADLVLTNGAVYTVLPRGHWAASVAIRDGKICYVGSNAGAEKFIYPGARVIDLKGKMVLPGFHDSHAHVLEGGVSLNMCSLKNCRSAEDCAREIKKYAAANPDREWILGFGWQLAWFPDGNPSRQILDGIDPKRPIAMICGDGHSIWASTRALREAGITRDTPDPKDGRIERGADREPSGTLREGAMKPVEKYFIPGVLEVLASLKKGVAELNRHGVTSFIEARANIQEQYDLAYKIVNFLGGLNARVTLSLFLDPHVDDSQVDDIISRYSADPASRLKADQVKFFIDGVTETRTAALFEPYLDRDGTRGILYFDMDRLKKLAIRLNRAGFQLHIHALGDRAAHEGLNVIEAVRRANSTNDRHHLVHLYLVKGDDIARMKKFNAAANIQPYWACPAFFNDVNLTVLGRKRFDSLFPFRSMRYAGVAIVGGTDWPVDTCNPLDEIEVAVTRQEPGKGPRAPKLNPGQALDLATMIEAYTINGARLQRRDKLTGSLEAGKYADLVVLDRNLFGIRPHEIHEAKVVATLLEGKGVYCDADNPVFCR